MRQKSSLLDSYYILYDPSIVFEQYKDFIQSVICSAITFQQSLLSIRIKKTIGVIVSLLVLHST